MQVPKPDFDRSWEVLERRGWLASGSREVLCHTVRLAAIPDLPPERVLAVERWLLSKPRLELHEARIAAALARFYLLCVESAESPMAAVSLAMHAAVFGGKVHQKPPRTLPPEELGATLLNACGAATYLAQRSIETNEIVAGGLLVRLDAQYRTPEQRRDFLLGEASRYVERAVEVLRGRPGHLARALAGEAGLCWELAIGNEEGPIALDLLRKGEELASRALELTTAERSRREGAGALQTRANIRLFLATHDPQSDTRVVLRLADSDARDSIQLAEADGRSPRLAYGLLVASAVDAAMAKEVWHRGEAKLARERAIERAKAAAGIFAEFGVVGAEALALSTVAKESALQAIAEKGVDGRAREVLAAAGEAARVGLKRSEVSGETRTARVARRAFAEVHLAIAAHRGISGAERHEAARALVEMLDGKDAQSPREAPEARSTAEVAWEAEAFAAIACVELDKGKKSLAKARAYALAQAGLGALLAPGYAAQEGSFPAGAASGLLGVLIKVGELESAAKRLKELLGSVRAWIRDEDTAVSWVSDLLVGLLWAAIEAGDSDFKESCFVLLREVTPDEVSVARATIFGKVASVLAERAPSVFMGDCAVTPGEILAAIKKARSEAAAAGWDDGAHRAGLMLGAAALSLPPGACEPNELWKVARDQESLAASPGAGDAVRFTAANIGVQLYVRCGVEASLVESRDQAIRRAIELGDVLLALPADREERVAALSSLGRAHAFGVMNGWVVRDSLQVFIAAVDSAGEAAVDGGLQNVMPVLRRAHAMPREY
jgi:hypothetical protein